jgi:hypothetical protein
MKNWKIIASALLALLVMVITPLAAMAQGQTAPSTGEKPVLNGALALVAPRIVRPGEDMSVTVLLRKDQTPVEEASIWALTKDKEQSLKTAIKKAMGKKGTVSDWQDLLNFLADKGDLMGETGSSGKLSFNLDEINNYILVAAKQGYVPDFSRLCVRQVLAIEAPESATVGEEVSLSVLLRGSEEPVSEAGVWAVKVEKAGGIKGKLAELRQIYKENFEESNWAEVLDKKAVSLGETDENGEAAYTFSEVGRYLLITVKKGYVPGFCGIAIVENEPAE